MADDRSARDRSGAPDFTHFAHKLHQGFTAWIFSQSTESAALMGFLHLLFWFIAVLFGMRLLRTMFKHASIRSDAGINLWLLIFLLVSVQMTCALRPILGTSDHFFPGEKKFFLTHWIECLDVRPQSDTHR